MENNVLKIDVQSEIGKLNAVLLHRPGAEVENMEGAALFALAEVLGFRAVEIRAISNYVGEEFSHWMVYDALNALAEELVNYYE
mgnify:CR=1 FL=1